MVKELKMQLGMTLQESKTIFTPDNLLSRQPFQIARAEGFIEQRYIVKAMRTIAGRRVG